MLKKTIFNDLHKELGARMVEFAGYEMPLDYSGVSVEHIAVRNLAGLFDVSHMGEIWVKGKDATSFLQKITVNDVSTLKPGKAQYSCMTNLKAGIIDDLIIYCYEPEKFMVVVNAANIEKDFNWMQKNLEGEVELENASDNISLLALQGPKAELILQKLTAIQLQDIPPFGFVTGQVGSAKQVIVSRTGYTGAGGFELYFYNNEGSLLFSELLKAGKDEGIVPVGLAARDTLRLEMGYCLYGNDIDDNTTPIEAGLKWIVKNPKSFIAKEIVEQQINLGIDKKLVGFEIIEKGIPRQGYLLVDEEDNHIGHVTSGTMSPSLKKGIGMGYVQIKFTKPNSIIYVIIRNKKLKAKIVKLPFYIS